MMSKKVEEIKEKEEVVKEKKARTKKVKEAEPKEEVKEVEKVKKTRTKKTKVEEPKEAEEIVEAEKIKDEEKTEIIEMKEEVTALAIFNNDELEILKKVIAEYRARTNTSNTTNSDTEKAKNFFENIDIPNEVRKIEYNTTLSIRGKQEIYDKIKEVAKKNGITASLLVNYLFYLILKPLGEWEKIK